MSSTRRPLRELPVTETLDLGSGLSLAPRLRLLLTFFRADLSVKPVDEWQFKRALLDFLSESLSLAVPEEDLSLRKQPDLHKRKREDPVATGALYVRELGFLKKSKYKGDGQEDESDAEVLKKRFLEWKASVVSKINGIELNIEGVKFRLSVEVPAGEDFDGLKKSWEEFYAFQPSGNRFSRGITRKPDTLIVKGLPSRWFAEPRVSSKPSMLVTHTILSVLGKIRNLNVAGNDDPDNTAEGGKGDIVAGLHCKIWVQFENYDDFCNALNALCGRSLEKQGSRLRADYEVTWDQYGFFRNIIQKTERSHIQERGSQMQISSRHLTSEPSRPQYQTTSFDSHSTHRKRFKE